MALRVQQGHRGPTPQSSASHPARGAQHDHGGRAAQQTAGQVTGVAIVAAHLEPVGAELVAIASASVVSSAA